MEHGGNRVQCDLSHINAGGAFGVLLAVPFPQSYEEKETMAPSHLLQRFLSDELGQDPIEYGLDCSADRSGSCDHYGYDWQLDRGSVHQRQQQSAGSFGPRESRVPGAVTVTRDMVCPKSSKW